MSDEEKPTDAPAEDAEGSSQTAGGAPDATAEAPESGEEPAWAAELDEYPLRDPSADPRWAVRTVHIWTGFALLCLLFILVLLVLGFFHD